MEFESLQKRPQLLILSFMNRPLCLLRVTPQLTPHMTKTAFPSTLNFAQSIIAKHKLISRDLVLHSGEDIEIYVREYHNISTPWLIWIMDA